MACIQTNEGRKRRSTTKAAFLCIAVGTFLVSTYLHATTDFSPPSIISSLRFQQHNRQTSLDNNDDEAIPIAAKAEMNSEENKNMDENNMDRQSTEKEEVYEVTTLQDIPKPAREAFRKKIDSLLKDEDTKNEVASQLDFAIVGFPKCGTTFLYSYLNTAESHVLRKEHCELSRNAPHDLILQVFPPPVEDMKVGFKCPRELESEYALDNFAKHFFKTKFIVSMRHPIHWFESFYNYVAFNLWPDKLPEPEELIGPCQDNGSPYICSTVEHSCPKKSKNLCTDRGKFHHALSRFGKTPMSTTHEMDLLNHHNLSITPSDAKIFLLEIDQLDEELDPAKAEIFRNDLRDFLGLEKDLPPMIRGEKARKSKTTEQNEFFINICDAKHAKLRHVLLKQGHDASTWIREFFIQSPDVTVSSPDYFMELLKRWEHDPCEEIILNDTNDAATAF